MGVVRMVARSGRCVPAALFPCAPRQVPQPMTKSQRWLPMCVLALGLALCPQRGFSQEPDEPDISDERINKSHQVFPFPDGDPNDSLLKRLQGKQLASFLDEYKKDRVDPGK